MPSTTVTLRGVSKVYPPQAGIKAATAVDAVSLVIEPGELFFLLGPSGCGKTTLLRMIAGFIEPTAGSILFTDDAGQRDVTFCAPEKRHTGMVFQSYALWPHMTVEQNVAFGLEIRKIPAPERARRVHEALAAVRMETYAARRPTQLSGGQQQRVALARALVIRPSVLLLDEPLSNLDAKLRLELRGEIRRVCKESGITTVYVTHDQKEALSMADRVAVMDAGKVVQIGTAPDIYRTPSSRFVAEFLGETNLLPGRIAAVSATGLSVEVAGTTLKSATFPSPGMAVGTDVSLSIRPEAIRPVDQPGPNILAATPVDSVYLGETAQLTLRLADGSTVRTSLLNPSADPGARTTMIAVSPEDVVVLPRA